VHEAVVPTPTIEKLPAEHSPLPLDELHPAWQYDAAGHAMHCALNPLPVTETAHTSLPPMHSQQGSIDRQLLIPLPAICDRWLATLSRSYVPTALNVWNGCSRFLSSMRVAE
jgi:hypothetical protein